ncbi:Na+/H+ antiporter subunit E [Herbivorax sp. ANBcel31]|uniref:Na+/H+ antiporter subunit E n=1 Tax=Herbivorax sp. ANBcel31 TaxID=3069754 RepID=UPI0027B7B509|nr:Na+/H+ antiporter subunit E [Herbivorax sp. ANBcel31]MDQ2086170.1 Na+/H+ antiporter subunit E [Herbivorax sp. ANBcel31]
MKKKSFEFIIVILCLIVWIILNESISISSIILGIIFGILSLFIVEKLLVSNYHEIARNLKLKIIFKYLSYLIFQIYISGFSAISMIVLGKTNVGIVEITTELKDDMTISILANSITLTPGTVTLSKSGNKLKILWLNKITSDSEKAGKLIKKDFEKILSGG